MAQEPAEARKSYLAAETQRIYTLLCDHLIKGPIIGPPLALHVSFGAPGSSHACERDALSIAHLEGKGAWNVLCVPKDEERCSGGAREVYREGVPLLRVGEGERLLGPESAARLVDDQHEAPMRRPHLSRGALAQ